MSDLIAINAQRRIERITADTIAEATKSYGKVLPFTVQAKIAALFEDELKPDVTADLQAEDAAWKADRAADYFAMGGQLASCSYSGESFSASISAGPESRDV